MALRVPESKNSRKQTPQTSPQNPHFDTLGTQIRLYGRGIQHGNGPTFEPIEPSGDSLKADFFLSARPSNAHIFAKKSRKC